MSRALHVAVLAVLVAVSLGAAGPSGSAAPPVPSESDRVAADDREVLVVDDDGDAQFETIGEAVVFAEDGTRIRVLPGTYRESVTIDENVTLVAPRGATLNGSTLADGSVGISLEDDASVVVDGFTIAHYGMGVDAAGRQDAAWELRNSTVESASFKAVRATLSMGDWTIANVTVVSGSTGIDATKSTGDWTVRDTVVRNASAGKAFDASPSAGNWTIRNATVVEADLVGVAASYSTGDWLVANSTIRGTSVGVGAIEATGDWTISGTTVAKASAERPYDMMMPPLREGVGVHAARTNGSWTIRESRFVVNDVAAVDASDAAPTGDAVRNWWGTASGPGDDDCLGNVDCGNALTDWPPATTTRPPATTTADTDGTATGPPGTAGTPGTDGTATAGEDAPTPLSPTLAVLAVGLATLFLAGHVARSPPHR